jgi:hypothetical protein
VLYYLISVLYNDKSQNFPAKLAHLLHEADWRGFSAS